MQADAGVFERLAFIERGPQAVAGDVVRREAGLVAGLGHRGVQRRQRAHGEEQFDGGFFIENEGIGHGQVDEHARRLRVGNLHDALARDHGAAQPVVGRAKHGNAVMRGSHFDAGQLGLHGSQLGPFFLCTALQLGQLAFTLDIVKRFLAGSHPFGIGHGHGLRSHFQAVAQRGVVQRDQQIALFDGLAGAHMEGFDDAVQRRSNGGGIERHDLGRGQRRLAHGEGAEQGQRNPDGMALSAQTLPALTQAEAGLAAQHFPAVAPERGQMAQCLFLQLCGFLLHEEGRPGEDDAVTPAQRYGKQSLGPPFQPAVQHFGGGRGFGLGFFGGGFGRCFSCAGRSTCCRSHSRHGYRYASFCFDSCLRMIILGWRLFLL